LVYVTNTNTVTVYTYPQGKLVGTLNVGYVPVGECVDKSGDVFVTNEDTGAVMEFAHGGKGEIAQFSAGVQAPVGCAIDPMTGNLAVAGLGPGGAGVAIFKQARGTPVIRKDRAFLEYFLLAYDDKGNLFVDGLTSTNQFIFAELPKSKRKFTYILLIPTVEFPGGVQWDGKYITVGDQEANTIYRYEVSSGRGNGFGTVRLGSGATDVFQYFIFQNQLLAPNQCSGTCVGDVLYYHWPKGGKATSILTDGVRYPHGVVVSKAP
jgi:hypothetical protein